MPTISNLRSELQEAISIFKASHSTLKNDMKKLMVDIKTIEQNMTNNKYDIWNKVFSQMNQDEICEIFQSNFSINAKSQLQKIDDDIAKYTQQIEDLNESSTREKITTLKNELETIDNKLSQLSNKIEKLSDSLPPNHVIRIANVIENNGFSEKELTDLSTTGFWGRLFNGRAALACKLNTRIKTYDETISSVFSAISRSTETHAKSQELNSAKSKLMDKKSQVESDLRKEQDNVFKIDNARTQLESLTEDNVKENVLVNLLLRTDIDPTKMSYFLNEQQEVELVKSTLELTAKHNAFKMMLNNVEKEISVIVKKIEDLEEKEYKTRKARNSSKQVSYTQGSISNVANSFRTRSQNRSQWMANNRSHIENYYYDDSFDLLTWYLIYNAMMETTISDASYGSHTDYMVSFDEENIPDVASEVDSFNTSGLDALEEFNLNDIDIPRESYSSFSCTSYESSSSSCSSSSCSSSCSSD